MKQETINKLHELEAQRVFWVSFKNSLTKGRNVCVQDYSHTPCTNMAFLNSTILKDWDEFQTYILKYVDTMINIYDEEIAEL